MDWIQNTTGTWLTLVDCIHSASTPERLAGRMSEKKLDSEMFPIELRRWVTILGRPTENGGGKNEGVTLLTSGRAFSRARQMGGANCLSALNLTDPPVLANRPFA